MGFPPQHPQSILPSHPPKKLYAQPPTQGLASPLAIDRVQTTVLALERTPKPTDTLLAFPITATTNNNNTNNRRRSVFPTPTESHNAPMSSCSSPAFENDDVLVIDGSRSQGLDPRVRHTPYSFPFHSTLLRKHEVLVHEGSMSNTRTMIKRLLDTLSCIQQHPYPIDGVTERS